MKLIKNSGQERVIDALREWISPGSTVDMMTSGFSIHAFGESCDVLRKVEKCRVILGASSAGPLALSGGESDRVFRSRLQGRWLSKQVSDWMARSVEVRFTPSERHKAWCLPQMARSVAHFLEAALLQRQAWG